MKVVLGNSFGGTRPEHKVYHRDQVEINDNITEVVTEDGTYYTADSTYYTYQEYAQYQDQLLQNEYETNLLQDEVSAQTLEMIISMLGE